jgi:hypothetical protein
MSRLIALGFAGAFRWSELVALTVADLVEAPDGYRVLIRRSKTDQEGQGQEIAIPPRLPAAAGGGGRGMAGSGRDRSRWPGRPPFSTGRNTGPSLGGGRIGVQDDGGLPPQEHGHPARLRPAGRSVPRPRGGGVPIIHLLLAFLIAGWPGVLIWLLLCGGGHDHDC